mmetsp:Transcript_3102/g.6987  ORF Transcript_3102/g.6987 Transcript_3102/m.6987 type:complete len:289 (-) Transcript_3102:8-874(-)
MTLAPAAAAAAAAATDGAPDSFPTLSALLRSSTGEADQGSSLPSSSCEAAASSSAPQSSTAAVTSSLADSGPDVKRQAEELAAAKQRALGMVTSLSMITGTPVSTASALSINAASQNSQSSLATHEGWPTPQQPNVAEQMAAAREKRKAIWEAGPNDFQDREQSRPSANGWEKSRMASDAERTKFLRLMGGQDMLEKSVTAEEEAARSSDSDFDESDILPGCQVLELEVESGDFVAVEDDPTSLLESNRRDAKENHQIGGSELDRMYQQGMQQSMSKCQGLGAAKSGP